MTNPSRKLVATLVVAFSCLLPPTLVLADNPENAIGLGIYKSMAAKPGNVFVSPASIYSATALLFEASQGETREKGAKFLGVTVEPDKPLQPKIIGTLGALDGSRSLTLFLRVHPPEGLNLSVHRRILYRELSL